MKFEDIERELIPEGASFVVKAIHRTGSLLAKRTQGQLADAGVFNLAEWRIASGLFAFGTASQKTLVDYTGSEQAHASRVLAGLEQRALVQSAQSQKDKRAREFALSAAGQAAYAQTLPSIAGFYDQIDTALSEAELATLITLLQRLLQAADAGGRSSE